MTTFQFIAQDKQEPSLPNKETKRRFYILLGSSSGKLFYRSPGIGSVSPGEKKSQPRIVRPSLHVGRKPTTIVVAQGGQPANVQNSLAVRAPSHFAALPSLHGGKARPLRDMPSAEDDPLVTSKRYGSVMSTPNINQMMEGEGANPAKFNRSSSVGPGMTASTLNPRQRNRRALYVNLPFFRCAGLCDFECKTREYRASLFLSS